MIMPYTVQKREEFLRDLGSGRTHFTEREEYMDKALIVGVNITTNTDKNKAQERFAGGQHGTGGAN